MSEPVVIQLPYPVQVIRFVRLVQSWTKAAYRALPSRTPIWTPEARLHNGAFQNGTLYLRPGSLRAGRPDQADTLLLEDTHHSTWLRLQGSAHALPYFLRLRQPDDLVVVEMADTYYPQFGSPARDRFDITPLWPGNNLAITINARYWHTLADAGMDTHYTEYYLYMAHLGFVDCYTEAADLGMHEVFNPEKVLDFRKMLY
ncbi:MAG: hypothetical protein SF053_13750 [Bacteroidia bacterium]|nr:hypothetical protein [Bacteroidia bacterium]